jgi:hypothetical protein
MEARADIPPIINAQARRASGPPKFAALVALAIVGAVLSSRLQLFFPKCTFLRLTGLPCAFCGGTRALRAIAHFDFVGAFWWNPLVTLAVFAAALSCALWAIVPAPAFDDWIARAKRLPVWTIIFVLIGVNWIFLLIFLPR